MTMRKVLLLSAVCFFTQNMTAFAKEKTDNRHGGVKKADQGASDSHHDKTDEEGEKISVRARHKVLGGGMMAYHTTPKTVSSLTHDYIDMQSPTSTIESLIQTLPGVVSASEGPLTTSYSTIHIRGMGQSEIGVTFEGIPGANPFTYSTYTPSLVDSENIGQINVMQGAVDINSPTYNATGAEISTSIRRPSAKQNIYTSASGGSYGTNKDFIRYDTGEIGHSGVRAFVSGSYARSDMWRGVGDVRKWHVDAALVKTWSKGNETEAIFGWTQARQNEWLYPSMANWKTYGTNYGLNDQYYEGDTDYAGLDGKNTGSIYGALKNHFTFGHGLSLDAEAYSVEFHGPYEYGESNLPVSSGYIGAEKYKYLDNYKNLPGYDPKSKKLTAAEVSDWYTLSSGLTLVGKWHHKFNTLTFSYWYSYATEAARDRYYPVNSKGQWSTSEPYLTAGGIPIGEDNENGKQQLNSFAVDDKLSFLHDRLTIDGGIRMAMVSRQFTQDLPGVSTAPSIRNLFIPAPQVLISYRFNPNHQIYVNGTTGYHLPAWLSSQLPEYSYTTGKPLQMAMSQYKPEYMITEELGYRYSGLFMANVAGFHYNVTNHQVSSETYQPGTTTEISQVINAGGLEAWGLQAELATRPWHHVSFYASGQYMYTQNGNNIAYGGGYLQTKGKQEVGAPKFSGSLGLTYNDGKWFGNFTLQYTDSQYATLMNDESIPSYVTANLGFGRTLPQVGRVKPRIKINLTNLGNEHYLSSIFSYTTNATAAAGVGGKSSAPTYVIGAPFVVMATLSANF